MKQTLDKEYLQLAIKEGKTSSDIAKEIGISKFTVRRYAKNYGIEWAKYRERPKNCSELIGKTFGRLTITDFGFYRKRSEKGRDGLWRCRCSCGEDNVFATYGNLNNGNVESCGCMSSDHLKKLHKGNIDDSATFRAVFKTYQWSAQKRNLKFNLTPEQFLQLSQRNCEYCNKPPSFVKNRNGKNSYKGKPFFYNGIDRVDNSQGYLIENCVSCCRICNIAKAGMTKQEFLDWIEKVFNNLCNKIN